MWNVCGPCILVIIIITSVIQVVDTFNFYTVYIKDRKQYIDTRLSTQRIKDNIVSYVCVCFGYNNQRYPGSQYFQFLHSVYKMDIAIYDNI